ncbi:MAG: hypothetical protein OXT51_07465, partial [Chloroflexota bacterium]|nr:hypothetical protein [Chloroflexota bacterium]
LRLPQGVGHVSAGAVFGALYALWAINYLASPVVAVVLEGGFNGSTITVGEQVILLAATVVLLLASGAAWVWSGQRVWRQWRTRAPAASALMGQDWHLEPWAWLVGLTLAFLLYVAMAAAMGFTGQ